MRELETLFQENNLIRNNEKTIACHFTPNKLDFLQDHK